MQETRFDDAIKKRLNNNESDVPGDMWERIVAEKKKRRLAFIPHRLAAILLLLGLGAICYFSFDHKNKSGLANETVTRNDNKDAVTKIKENNKPGSNTTQITHDKIIDTTDAVKNNDKSSQLKKDSPWKKPLRKKINHRRPSQTKVTAEKQNIYNAEPQKENSSNSEGTVAQTATVPDKKETRSGRFNTYG